MANDVLARDRDTVVDAHPVVQTERRLEGELEKRAVEIVAGGLLAPIQEQLGAIADTLRRHEHALVPYSPEETRIMQLERENGDLKYYLYAACGLLLFLFLMARR